MCKDLKMLCSSINGGCWLSAVLKYIKAFTVWISSQKLLTGKYIKKPTIKPCFHIKGNMTRLTSSLAPADQNKPQQDEIIVLLPKWYVMAQNVVGKMGAGDRFQHCVMSQTWAMWRRWSVEEWELQDGGGATHRPSDSWYRAGGRKQHTFGKLKHC